MPLSDNPLQLLWPYLYRGGTCTFFIHPPRKNQLGPAFLISKKPQSSITLLLFSQFVLLKVNFKDHKITTVILIESTSKSSGNSLYVSSPHISLTLELRCCDSAWVSPSPLGTPPAPYSRNGLVTGCNPPGTGATSSYLLSIESWICKRAARHGGISPI